MGGDTRGMTVARRWELALACLAGVLVAVAVSFAAAAAVPPMLANLSTEVSDGRAPTSIGPAPVVVPADWLITRESADAVIVRTPDGALRARLDAVTGDPAATVAGTDGAGPVRTEQLASGLTAVHADLDDGGLVAVVGPAGGGASVRVVAELPAPDDAAGYRAAVGDLLEGVRP